MTKSVQDIAFPAHHLPAEGPLLHRLILSMEQQEIRYCHWKSTMRLDESLAGADDVDLLIDRRHAGAFHALLISYGFRFSQSRSGIDHPGVFHALALDESTSRLVHVHAYFQIITGDSLVKSYRVAVEGALLDQTRFVSGVRVPTFEAELVFFAIRSALKHAGLIELLLVRRDQAGLADEMSWLRKNAQLVLAVSLCADWFPEIPPNMFRDMVEAYSDHDASLAKRVSLGWRAAHLLRHRRRMSGPAILMSRTRRVFNLAIGRFRRKRDLVLQSSGMIVALVGPKATGKSTLSDELAAGLGRHLEVVRIHAGKPPPTVPTLVMHMLVPLARWLYPRERSGTYEDAAKRGENRYSSLFVMRMLMLAHDRRILLRRSLRQATAGAIVISDRYPSVTNGAIDSCRFDEIALSKAGSRVQRWLMRREQMANRDLPKPGLVIRLIAPMETAIRRDASRDKDGGPDAATVARRWDLETMGEFDAPVVDVPTDRRLEETVADVLKECWSRL